MTRYATINDATEQYTLTALGDYAADYDCEAITREAFAYRTDTDEHGNEVLTRAGFELAVTDEEFWTIVAKHEN